MVINVRKYRYLFKEVIQIDKKIRIPIVVDLCQVRIIPNDIQPFNRNSQTAGIWEKDYKPDEAQEQIDDPEPTTAFGIALRHMMNEQYGSKDQEGYAGKVVIDVRTARNKYPGQELCKQTNQDKGWRNVPITAEDPESSVTPGYHVPMST